MRLSLLLPGLFLLTGFSPARPGESKSPVRVVIQTDLGDIEVAVDSARAPLTAANFLKYVEGKFYDGGSFHRTVKPDNQPDSKVRIEVIQAGIDPKREKEQFPPIALERTNQTGLKHRDGTVSMARDGPDTATSDFFICLGDQPELDLGGKRNPDGQGFAAFGQVVRGMDVVRKVQQAPAAGQKLTPPVRIRQVRRVAESNGKDWIVLSGERWKESWREPLGDWFEAGGVSLDPRNPERLATEPGRGVLVNGPKGPTSNLLTKQSFADLDVSLEFVVPKGSNSGVKLMGLYEIQIFDSWGVQKPKATDCGGIYPRAEMLPQYHHIDAGFPPRTNACRPPGEWQTLEIEFLAPRFQDGKKVSNAKFVRVLLNAVLVQENVDVPTPTGHAWRLEKEVPAGPLLLQADHGPVAFREVRMRPRR
jgi:peptidyl-prolyl cis-trans isomerase A (cyclophilin A)